PNVDAVSTTVIRSITSMSSCTQALRSKSGKSDMPLHLSMRYGTDTDSVLFKAGDYDASMRLFSSFSDSIKVNNDGHVFLSRIIRNPAKAEKKFGNNRKLVEAVAKTLSFYGPAAIPEMNPSLWLTVDEMSEFGKHSNAAVYCYARQHYADGLPKTASFLRYLIAQADEAIAGNGICANLRFAHDTQMGVVLSLMGVEGMNGVYKADEIDKYFCSGLKIPMAVNFEVVFYKNDKGDVLVKILHNEEEKTLVGLEPFAGPYYRWNDVKAYWEGRCNGSIPVEIRK
nr:hypothetical protein [Bacteroidales bacterium]